MKLILLSGGSGKRLWPLSNDSRSKQFLRLLDNNGNLESMVQRVWGQLEKLKLNESTVIATSRSQLDIIQSQLGSHVHLIVEPERRDTFPAIALSAAYLYSVKCTSLKEIVGVLPVDPYVDISYFERIMDLEEVLHTSNSDLALMGVSPTYPSEKYGYIVPMQNNENEYIQVSHFKEKPSEAEAKDLMVQDALWNCGVFVFKLEYIISLLQAKGLPIQYDELLNQYQQLENTSFDYAVVEKANKIVALPYSGGWKDLGTWNTLTEEMATKVIGKGIVSADCKNTHLINELDIPVAILGVSNIVVAVSPDGILVTDKEASSKVKGLVASFEQRPMYEERRWGWYQVLDYTKFPESREVLTKKICVTAGKNLSYQLHNKRSEVWTIIEGKGEFALDDRIVSVNPGDVLNIPLGSKHGIKAISDLQFIEVQSGSDLVEEDIVRLFMTWEEVKRNCLIEKK
jgi:mannose-1-phosphate guanylyltransferase